MKNIEIKNLTKIYGQGESECRALDGVSFSLEKGEFVVILGPSGSGKSTLINILGGMDKATSGECVVDGVDIVRLNERKLVDYRRDSVGFVFQFYNLMRNLTAVENVALSQQKGGMTANEALNAVGLSACSHKFPANLSGGEQQRVAIARAIVKNPKVLLCDEPTGALDSKTGKQVLKLLLELVKQGDKTVVVVTHNASFAGLANRVIRLSDGKIVANNVNDNPKDVEDIDW